MASAIAHFIVGAAVALPAMESRSIRARLPPWAIPVSAGLCAVAPDFDTFAMRALDIPYESFFGHRGFFHAPFFLMLVAAAIVRPAWLAVTYAASAITHPLLDALTDGGAGVMLLFPFSNARLFFPWRPIHVSPLGILAFFDRAGYILRSEFPFCLVAIVMGAGVRLALARGTPPTRD
jgi:inner membrane protein